MDLDAAIARSIVILIANETYQLASSALFLISWMSGGLEWNSGWMLHLCRHNHTSCRISLNQHAGRLQSMVCTMHRVEYSCTGMQVSLMRRQSIFTICSRYIFRAFSVANKGTSKERSVICLISSNLLSTRISIQSSDQSCEEIKPGGTESLALRGEQKRRERTLKSNMWRQCTYLTGDLVILYILKPWLFERLFAINFN